MAGFDQSIIFLSKSRYKLHKIREEYFSSSLKILQKWTCINNNNTDCYSRYFFFLNLTRAKNIHVQRVNSTISVHKHEQYK